jgi:hypothetical protein
VSSNIPEVGNNALQINTAEFVKLKIYNDFNNTANVSTYTVSSAYREETIANVAYTPLGGLLSVGAQARDIRVTAGDTSISLSGIDGNNIFVVLDSKIRGSELTIYRGFYDANYVLANTYQRFTGIVTNYNITEDRVDNEDNFTVGISASSFKTVLENRVAGRKTNKESWRFFNSNDSSMDQVYSITGVAFDFGMKPQVQIIRPGPDPYINDPYLNPVTPGLP